MVLSLNMDIYVLINSSLVMSGCGVFSTFPCIHSEASNAGGAICTELPMAEFPVVSTASPKSAIPERSRPRACFNSSFHAVLLAVRLGAKIVHVPIASTVRELEAFLDKRVIIPPGERSTTRPCYWGQDTDFSPHCNGWFCV